eukprot:TRINITY_DN2538_c4_g1_i1.p1 TRINITY_DN2538_c4_g1~~TRINITY_DN2538_c4_g1_i1.p1  ORF type:complete len:825 (+),score=282.36 TRINITY_DN2538_c4_g1_i1:92-2566(+)
MPEKVKTKAEGAATVPIAAIIIVATVISVLASLAGGLVMYGESLAALEKTVEETSKSELLGVSVSIMTIVDAAREDAQVLHDAAYSFAPQTEQEWADYMRSVTYGLVKVKSSHYCFGMVGLPHASSPNDAFYAVLWVDPLRDGSQVLSMGFHHNRVAALDPNYKPAVTGNATAGYMVDTPTFEIHMENGTIGKWLYAWNGAGSVFAALKFTEEEQDWQDENQDGILGRRHRGNEAWFSPDRLLYSYSGYDTVFAPPPAPHPFSHLRGVGTVTLFDYASWADALARFQAGMAEGTEIVVMDDVTLEIYATTTGETMLDQTCFDSAPEGQAGLIDTCATRLDKMSPMVQQVYHAFPKGLAEAFRTTGTDKGEMFTRKAPLYNNVVLLWMRPTSTIQDRVNSALTLLVIFAAVVFVLNLLVGGFEFSFIAKPMMEISHAVACVGSMDTEMAQELLAPLLGKSFMVKEAQVLVVHLNQTISNLVEFRSYMPQSVLLAQEAPTSDEESTSGQGSRKKGSRSARNRSNRSARSAGSHATTITQTAQAAKEGVAALAMSLQQKKFSFLVMNTHGFLAQICGAHGARPDTRDMLSMVTVLVTVTTDALKAHRGVLEHFSGDRFYCSFGGSLPVGSHDCKALGAATQLMSLVMKRVSLRCSIAVTTGKGYIGNAGTMQVRKFTYLSPRISLACELVAFAKVLGGAILSANLPRDSRNSNFVQRLVGAAVCEKVHEAHELDIVETLTAVESDGKNEREWMYELEESACAKKWAVWDEWVASIVKGDWIAAEKCSEPAKALDDTSSVAQYFQRFYQSRCACIPVDLGRPYATAGF